ncbi:MAG TPA: hypothetical protein VFB07_09195 [Vicinamibacterales bacterium]|nr:hypothetical protein [Vicinamibacterales bacterium]
MRGYFVPLVAGVVLAVSAFLPWVIVSGQSLRGVPDMAALWIIGLGALASVLALLSLITRRNSRHPLFLIGLVAVGIMFLSWRILPRSAGERALIISQASSIVERTPMSEAPTASAGSGIYVGLAAALAIAGFGLTIVIKRVATPYVADAVDDDVE